jgi:hypothetical protein
MHHPPWPYLGTTLSAAAAAWLLLAAWLRTYAMANQHNVVSAIVSMASLYYRLTSLPPYYPLISISHLDREPEQFSLSLCLSI